MPSQLAAGCGGGGGGGGGVTLPVPMGLTAVAVWAGWATAVDALAVGVAESAGGVVSVSAAVTVLTAEAEAEVTGTGVDVSVVTAVAVVGALSSASWRSKAHTAATDTMAVPTSAANTATQLGLVDEAGATSCAAGWVTGGIDWPVGRPDRTASWLAAGVTVSMPIVAAGI